MADIGIIGVGKNGEAFAHSLLKEGHNVYLLNRTPKRAYGVMEDLIDAYPHQRDNIHVCEQYDETFMNTDMAFVLVKGDYEYSDFKVLSDLRTKGLPRDGFLLNNVASHLKDYKGYVVVVSNPVDVNAKIIMDKAGLSPHQVVAYGQNLDTLRGQNETAYRLGISLDPSTGNREALTLMYAGEHGDKGFGLWSSATYRGKPLTELGVDETFMREVDKYVRMRGVEVILKKGDTTIGTVQPLAEMVQWLLNDDYQHVIPVSIFDEKHGTFLGQPAVHTNGQFVSRMPGDLSPLEEENLEAAIAKTTGGVQFASALYVDRQIRHVLYLDDERTTLGAVKGQLKAMARQDTEFCVNNMLMVHVAHTVREAKEALYKFNMDVLVTDQVLRGDDTIDSGLDFVVQEVLPNHPFTETIMLSGQATEDVLKKAIGPKFAGYVQKPLNVKDPEHWAVIRNALRRTEEAIID